MKQLNKETMTEASNARSNKREKALLAHLKTVGAQAGSLHYVSRSQDILELIVSVGLPPQLTPAIERIPRGKGLAGQAWFDGEVVVSCNLANDPRTGLQAKTLPFQSTYALPVYDGEEIIAVLGVAFDESIELTRDQQEQVSNLPPELSPIG